MNVRGLAPHRDSGSFYAHAGWPPPACTVGPRSCVVLRVLICLGRYARFRGCVAASRVSPGPPDVCACTASERTAPHPPGPADGVRAGACAALTSLTRRGRGAGRGEATVRDRTRPLLKRAVLAVSESNMSPIIPQVIKSSTSSCLGAVGRGGPGVWLRKHAVGRRSARCRCWSAVTRCAPRRLHSLSSSALSPRPVLAPRSRLACSSCAGSPPARARRRLPCFLMRCCSLCRESLL